MRELLILGVLLLAVPLFPQHPKRVTQPATAQAGIPVDPRLRAGKLRWFTLGETPKGVEAVFGRPSMVAESGANWISWQYRVGDDVGHEDFTHQFLFERGSGKLLCVVRSYEQERDVAALFPPKQTTVSYFPNRSAPRLALRIRRLGDGRVLTALGESGPTNQIALLRPETMALLYPWVSGEAGSPAPSAFGK